MATRLHLLTLSEQFHLRQKRRTNRRLLFVAAYCLLIGFLVGTLVGCGAGVEATPEEQVRVPPPCVVEVAPGQFKPGDCPRAG